MKIITEYHHDPADLSFIYLAMVPPKAEPTDEDWRPAYRDTIDGQLVVWVKFDDWQKRLLWLKDRHGIRKVTHFRTG